MVWSFVLTIALCTVLVLGWGWYEAHRNKVMKQIIELGFMPTQCDELTFFFISDIHRRSLSSKMINAVKGRAEFVIIGGDLCEKGVPFERIESNLKKLTSIGPTFFVWGNNDYEVNHNRLSHLLKAYRITSLTNDTCALSNVDLIGVDDLLMRRDKLDLALLSSFGSFKILVSHNPEIVQKLPHSHNISLILSGHTHGGQIRFWKWGLYPKGGLTYQNHTWLFVSNGYGTSAIPFRFFAPSQTHLITLRQKGVDEG